MYLQADKTRSRQHKKTAPLVACDSGASISTELVGHLREQGMTLRQIGQLIDATESYISRVSHGERSFTLDHLARFERKLGQSIPVLLLESKWRKHVPRSKKAIFEEALRLLKEWAAISAELAE